MRPHYQRPNNRFSGRQDALVPSAAEIGRYTAQLAEGLSVSDAKDEVVELDLGIVPEAAVSGPLLLQDDNSAYLTFNAMRLGVDGLYETAGTAIVEIVPCGTTKFGYPNDEAIAGHPLYARGLDAYSIFEVLNSSWAAEQAAQNRVSFPNTSGTSARHYIFTFHDSTFECLAEGIKVEVSEEPYEQIFRRVSELLLRGSV